MSIPEPVTFGGYEYTFLDVAATAQHARQRCKSWDGGDLASIMSQEANAFLNNYTTKANNCPDTRLVKRKRVYPLLMLSLISSYKKVYASGVALLF